MSNIGHEVLSILSPPPEKGTQSQGGFQPRLLASSTCRQEGTAWQEGPQGTKVDFLEGERLHHLLAGQEHLEHSLAGRSSKLLLRSRFLLPCQPRLVLPPVRGHFSLSIQRMRWNVTKRRKASDSMSQKKQADTINASFALLTVLTIYKCIIGLMI